MCSPHGTARRLLPVCRRSWIGVPDLHPAEQRQVGGELAVALHRIEDFVVLHAVAPAGEEVLDAVGGRLNGRCLCPCPALRSRPGTRATRDRRTDGGSHVLQRAALGAWRPRCPSRPYAAGSRVEPGPAASTSDRAACVDQRVVEIRMHVQRLVRRNRPRRGRPDHGETGPRAAARARMPWRASPRSPSSSAKPTSIAGSMRSSYSTSASASALPQSKHQLTGFRPRYR